MNTIAPLISISSLDATETATKQLRSGNIVALPTETVYGLGANACNDKAVASIYTAKGRPSNNPLICHVCDTEMAARYVEISATAQRLMDHYWPGPLTIVLPRKKDGAQVADMVSAGLNTLAVRCPDQDQVRDIIKRLGSPVAAPSANPSGQLSPTTAKDVQDTLGDKISLILDNGPSSVGIESTIVGVLDNEVTLLRPGTITSEDISEFLGQPVKDREGNKITAPGQLMSHYAPNAKVRLNAAHKNDGETLIGFGKIAGDFTLSATGRLDEAARNLFTTLRQADTAGCDTIAVAPIPNHGIGVAINDRLTRAAAPRDK